mmetsp:Transcript_40971/g.82677  ORF Transcript_40971/g.82677 Transcript_40971/m.82677 type:complete len:295 (-) Transcript_40971:613-1497(-)
MVCGKKSANQDPGAFKSSSWYPRNAFKLSFSPKVDGSAKGPSSKSRNTPNTADSCSPAPPAPSPPIPLPASANPLLPPPVRGGGESKSLRACLSSPSDLESRGAVNRTATACPPAEEGARPSPTASTASSKSRRWASVAWAATVAGQQDLHTFGDSTKVASTNKVREVCGSSAWVFAAPAPLPPPPPPPSSLPVPNPLATTLAAVWSTRKSSVSRCFVESSVSSACLRSAGKGFWGTHRAKAASVPLARRLSPAYSNCRTESTAAPTPRPESLRIFASSFSMPAPSKSAAPFPP